MTLFLCNIPLQFIRVSFTSVEMIWQLVILFPSVDVLQDSLISCPVVIQSFIQIFVLI